VILKPHTLEYRAVMSTKVELTCMLEIIFVKCLWTIFVWLSQKTCPSRTGGFSALNFEGIFSPYLASIKAITLASFQDDGKYDSRKQWLNRCVRWTSGLLGRFLRHSFGMPSISHAFLNFGEGNFCMSQGLTLSGGGGVVLGFKQSFDTSLWCSSHRSCGVSWFSKEQSRWLFPLEEIWGRKDLG
jgi:hypothetical protein